jgi:LacI family transcriptional regulator
MLRLDGAYGRGVLRGATAYAQSATVDWAFRHLAPEDVPLEALRLWKPDAVVTQLADASVFDRLRELAVPVVSASLDYQNVPSVGTPETLVVDLAVEHFASRGLRHVGYAGYGWHNSFSPLMSAAAHAAGMSFHLYDFERYRLGSERFERPADAVALWRWLSDCPKPIGLLAAHDHRAWEVAEVCRSHGIRVPEDVALIGVENDEPLCASAYPALSSVALAADRIGYEAAGLLDRLMQGAKPPRRPIEVPPIGVIARQSTDVLAVDEPAVADAVRFVRTRAGDGLGVGDVLRAVPVSRRWLERRFRTLLGRSILQEIHRARAEQAKRLLATTDLPMPDVAERSGYANPKLFSATFRKHFGMTPTTYRRQSRLRAT